MNRQRGLIIASLMVSASIASAHSASEGKKGMEKCLGITAKAMNDCGTSKHTCAGQAVADNDPEEWIYVPTGTCKKITSGSVKK